ncbi:MAG: T9SS type A sorting domain-containing protein [Prevotellaceae bacterium]|jgi:hypothetical protein|nr:T9SS type A sorting domain-containing protein [Prevotellaceae bacterium]
MKKIVISSIVCAIFCLQHLYLHAQNGVFLGAGTSITNSVVWGNTDNTSALRQISGTGSVSYTAVQGVTPTGAGNIALPESPFADAAEEAETAYSLREGSPCINSGSGSNLPEKDLAGYPRIWNSTVDMGAYEYPYPRTITVKPKDASKNEGERDPNFESEIGGDGLYGTDEIRGAITRVDGESVGSYDMDIEDAKVYRGTSSRDLTSRYSIVVNKGTFTILDGGSTGVEKGTDVLSALLYPVPTTGQVYLRVDDTESAIKVQVYNLIGILLLEQEVGEGQSVLNFSSLPDGILFVKVNSGSKSKTIQILKYK